jgi:hypothetical protein
VFAGFIGLVVAVTFIPTVKHASAAAQPPQCFDLNTLFFEEYFPGERWGRLGRSTTITWSSTAPIIQGRQSDGGDEPVVRAFTTQEDAWIQRAMSAWDDALTTVSFTRVNRPNADLTIGVVEMARLNYPGHWNAWGSGLLRERATIKLRSDSTVPGGEASDEAGFTHVVLHEVGNVLGLGDISLSTLRERSPGSTSVMLDPREPPLAVIPLSEFDRSLIKQVYGEVSCPTGAPSTGEPVRTCARYSTGRPDCTNSGQWVYNYCHKVPRYRIEVRQRDGWSTVGSATAPRSGSCFRNAPFQVQIGRAHV